MTTHIPQVQIGPDGHRTDVARDDGGVARCMAKRRRQPGPCQSNPVRGSLRCRMHGGKMPKGPAAPNYRHGRTSKWRSALGLPVLEPDDASMLDVRAGVQIQEKAIEGIGRRLAENDSPHFRERCRDLMAEVRSAIASGNAAEIGPAVRALEVWIQRGNAEDRSLRDLSQAAERLSRQIEGAHRARVNAVNAVNNADLVRFFASFVAIVREEVGQDGATRVFARCDREILGGRLGGDARIVVDTEVA